MKTLIHEATWYGVASLCALTVDAGSLWILVRVIGLAYLTAATISFLVGATVAYVISVRLAFRSHRLQNRRAEFAGFVALGAPGLALNAGVISVAVEYLGIHFMIAKFMAAGVTFGFNFCTRRQLLFLQRRSLS